MTCPYCGSDIEYDSRVRTDGERTICWKAKLWCRICGAETEWIEHSGWDIDKEIDLDTFDWDWK